MRIDRKEKQKLISELAAKGMKAPEIAQQTGINYKSVYYYMNRERYKPKKRKWKRFLFTTKIRMHVPDGMPIG